MKNNNQTTENKLLERMDNLHTLLEDLFILQALKGGISADKVRDIMKINRDRISAISKHIKE